MLLIPAVLAQVALSFTIMFVMIYYRVIDIRVGHVIAEQVPTRTAVWGKKASLASSNFLSQFEIPILFFALALLQIVTKTDDQIQLYLAWAFIFFRLCHTLFHVFIPHGAMRVITFAISSFILLAMWKRFAFALYF